MSKTICSAFWKHTNLRGDNRIFPCCRFKEPIATFDGNLQNVLHSAQYEKLRQQSLNGELIKGCEKCYYEEDQGRESLRQKFNKEYAIDNVSLEYFEIGFDNICNLACDGCFSEFSSTWAAIENPLLPKKLQIINTVEITDIPSSISKILFLGGEPLMTNRHRKFLEQVNTKDKVEVIYNTNGTFLLDDQTIDLLKEFKKVSFIVSVDGYNELNNKVRKHSKWDDILKFLIQLTETGFAFSIHTTIHLNNWHGLKDLAEWVSQHNYVWTVNILTYPKHLDIKNLELEQKQHMIELIKETSIPDKTYVLNHLEEIKNDRP
jgi:sulfatase maturation enzyme AslB (radical SAM superfamily)